MNREQAKEQAISKMICRQSHIPFLKLIDQIYDDFENSTCGNCKFYNDEYCDNDSCPFYLSCINLGDGCNHFKKIEK